MRPEILYPLFADISNLRGVGAKTQKLLTTLIGGNKIVDLAFHLPINLIDRRYCISEDEGQADHARVD